MSNVNIGAGIAKGSLATQQYVRTKPERDARTAEAKARQQQAEESIANAPVRQSAADLALKQNQLELKRLNSTTLKKDTYTAFNSYETDKDVKHINNFLAEAKSNPAGKRMYGDLARVDKITRTPQTEAMLSRAGIQDLNGFFDDPDKNGNFVIGTGTDGNQKLINLDNVYQATGFTSVMQAQQLETLKTRTQHQQLQSTGMLFKDMGENLRTAHMIKDELGIPLNEAIERLQKAKASGGSQIERLAKTLQAENPNMSWSDAMKKAAETIRSGSTQEREASRLMDEDPDLSRQDAMDLARKNVQPKTSVSKNLEQAEEVRTTLDEVGGGDFLTADMQDPKVRRAAGRHITALEKLTGKALSNQDKRVMRDMRELTHLGAKVGDKVGEEETGILDKMFNDLKKYVSDNVDTVEGTAAYETFRNSIRHALYGATLSQGEIAAFNNAAGTLGQQAGPVLQQFATQLETVKSQLQTIYDMNDEYVAKYYVGSSLEEVDVIIEQIEERIKLLNTDTVGDVQQKAPTGERRSLDEIFGGNP